MANWLARAKEALTTDHSAEGDLVVAESVKAGELGTAKTAEMVSEGRAVAVDNRPHYRWLILEADGGWREVCCLPPLERKEIRAAYPEGREWFPLPDSAAEAGAMIYQAAA